MVPDRRMNHKVINFADPGLIRDRVVEALREAIIEGRLEPGERIRERELVISLGISRSPIREAIRVLEGEGLITTAPHRGAWVSELGVADLRETTDVRIMLETFAARLTCRHLQEATLNVMAEQIDLARVALKDREIATDLNYSMGFHDLFVEACGNSKVIQLYQIVKRHLRRYQLLAFSRLGRAERAIDEHMEILSTFRNRNAAGVERLVTIHLVRASEEIISHLSPKDRCGATRSTEEINDETVREAITDWRDGRPFDRAGEL